MEQRIKEWIEREYENTIKFGDNCSARYAIDRCYGVIMFAVNNLFENFNDELSHWWNDEMLPKFRELEERD